MVTRTESNSGRSINTGCLFEEVDDIYFFQYSAFCTRLLVFYTPILMAQTLFQYFLYWPNFEKATKSAGNLIAESANAFGFA